MNSKLELFDPESHQRFQRGQSKFLASRVFWGPKNVIAELEFLSQTLIKGFNEDSRNFSPHVFFGSKKNEC